ncbi:MAG TPA: DUF3105 domain-containing protein [Gaiellaceae bacterium]|nr:DUF3105 domain-containing protein [Gaiellaceae bacterium]
MAKKKPRTPPPPRRVQAPQRRVEPRKPRQGVSAAEIGRGRRNLLYAIAAGGAAVVVAIVVAVTAFGGGSKRPTEQQVANAMAAAGCSFRTVPAFVPKSWPPLTPLHLNSLTKKFPWNTSPPSNGLHYPEWAVWGFYTSPVNPRMVVHNEEHGGVILWWGSKVPQSTVEKLRSFYEEEPDGLFGTPYPSLGNKIAITAWTGDTLRYLRNRYFGEGHIAKCSSYTPATKRAFTLFRDRYRGHGPEGIPLSADAPGLGPS